jgi:hypothetical protein
MSSARLPTCPSSPLNVSSISACSSSKEKVKAGPLSVMNEGEHPPVAAPGNELLFEEGPVERHGVRAPVEVGTYRAIARSSAASRMNTVNPTPTVLAAVFTRLRSASLRK